MSTWGRAQDALIDLLDGMEISQAGDRSKGLLEDKLPYKEIHDLIDPILEAVMPVADSFWRPQVESLTTENAELRGAMPSLEALYWFFMMVESGGPDGSDLDAAVWDDARAAAATMKDPPPKT